LTRTLKRLVETWCPIRPRSCTSGVQLTKKLKVLGLFELHFRLTGARFLGSFALGAEPLGPIVSLKASVLLFGEFDALGVEPAAARLAIAHDAGPVLELAPTEAGRDYFRGV
jgi:hypothetical protein